MTCLSCGGTCTARVVRVHRNIVLGLYALGFVLSWVWGGSLLHDLAEGLQRSLLPLWKALVPVLVFVLATVAAFVRRTQPVCERCNLATPSWLWSSLSVQQSSAVLANPTRRVVLRTLGGVGTGVAATAGGFATAVARNRGWLPVANDFFLTKVEKTAASPRPEWRAAKIVSYRRLGRTNVNVSDISLGGGGINDVSVARYALEKGINYFDTSPDYSDAASERVLGEALKGQRDKVFLATKFCRPDGHLHDDTPVPEIMEAVEASLKRLQTDHVDLIHVHSCDRVERLLAPNIHEAFDRLKEQGKVRFLGVSTHTPNLEAVANAAIDSKRFDVMMLAYHHSMWPNFTHILEKAQANDVGVVAMKTLKGAKHINLASFRDESGVYSQAAFRWVLSNPAVGCLVISIVTQEQVDEYVFASGTALKTTDVALLSRYDELTAGDYCAPHCGACIDKCPFDVPINDIMRHRMYFKDYGWQKHGMQAYAKLEQRASQCVDCAAPCAGSCPIGVPIQDKMLDAHQLLSFTA